MINNQNNEIYNYSINIRGVSTSRRSINYSLQDRIYEIQKCIDNELWISALCLTLTLPDICSKIEFSNIIDNNKRYTEWLKNNIDLATFTFADISYSKEDEILINKLTCYIIYKLRCALIHEGTGCCYSTTDENDPLFTSADNINTANMNISLSIKNNTNIIIPKVDVLLDNSKKIEEKCFTVNVPLFCKYICDICSKYYENNKSKFRDLNINIVDYL